MLYLSKRKFTFFENDYSNHNLNTIANGDLNKKTKIF